MYINEGHIFLEKSSQNILSSSKQIFLCEAEISIFLQKSLSCESSFVINDIIGTILVWSLLPSKLYEAILLLSNQSAQIRHSELASVSKLWLSLANLLLTNFAS